MFPLFLGGVAVVAVAVVAAEREHLIRPPAVS